MTVGTRGVAEKKKGGRKIKSYLGYFKRLAEMLFTTAQVYLDSDPLVETRKIRCSDLYIIYRWHCIQCFDLRSCYM